MTGPRLQVLVETPMGSRNKYELDKDTGNIRFDRMLFSSVHYPVDYGFIPETLAEDGDPLDALVLMTEPTFPGCMIEIRPIGMLKMSDEKGKDYKVLGVPVTDPRWNHMRSLEDIPDHYQREIEHFFAVYKALERKHVEVEGWGDVESALAYVEDSRRRYVDAESE